MPVRSGRLTLRRAVGLPLAAFLAWTLIAATSAQATIVTIGSPLSASFSSVVIGVSGTFSNSALGEPRASVSSPVDGVIVRWRITQAAGGPFALHVLTPVNGTTATGGETSAPETPVGPATQTFASSLPIKAGQLIGLDNATSTDQVGVAASASGSTFSFWAPPLGSGETRGSSGSASAEIGFNADVATAPSNADTLGKVKLNKNNGTARLSVNVPGPGTLSPAGRNLRPQRPTGGATAGETVTAAGTARLLVRASGRAKKKLNQTGTAKVRVRVTYRPTGDLPGVPNTQTKTLELVKLSRAGRNPRNRQPRLAKSPMRSHDR